MHTKFWLENKRERDRLGNLINEGMRLTSIVKKTDCQDVCVGLIWLRIGPVCEILTANESPGFQKNKNKKTKNRGFLD
jgi:hypothetical protein